MKQTQSIWQATQALPTYPTLTGNLKTEVLVIGGGLAGLLSAYFLNKAGARVVLLEGDTLCGGVTARTTGKVTAQQGAIYHKLLNIWGREQAALYYRANTEAIAAYRDLTQGWDCLVPQDAILFATDRAGTLEREQAALQALSIPFTWSEQVDLPFATTGAIRFSDQAALSPLRLAAHLAEGLTIYTHTPVLRLDGTTAHTPTGTVTADRVIVATHFPFFRLWGGYALKMYQERAYVLAVEGASFCGGMYLDVSGQGLSLRDAEGMLLVGGGSHRTGESGAGWHPAESFLKQYDPDATIRYRFATQDCMTLDGMPYVGAVARGSDRVFVATGFSKWGMCGSMVAARLLTDLLTGKENPYAALLSPARKRYKRQLFANIGTSAKNLIRPTVPRCPHLGCALRYNKREHTWDCPCHGSRFTADGKRILGPANRDKH